MSENNKNALRGAKNKPGNTKNQEKQVNKQRSESSKEIVSNSSSPNNYDLESEGVVAQEIEIEGRELYQFQNYNQ